MPLDRLFPFQGFDKLGNTLLGPSTAPSILLSGAAKRRALRAAATAGCQRTRGRGGIGSWVRLQILFKWFCKLFLLCRAHRLGRAL